MALLDEVSEYKLPFQDEVGSNPSLDEMKEIVVDKCQRPVIKPCWLKNQVSLSFTLFVYTWNKMV